MLSLLAYLLTTYKIRVLPLISILWLICELKYNSQAQTCDGVLGNPVVNQTFGQGVRKPLQSGQTTYDYVTKTCPSDGEYTVADSMSGNCFSSTWHRVITDHTPDDVNGNMLIINASFGSGAIFYVQPLSGLCSGTTYEFSFWVLNLYNPLSPKGCGALDPRDPNITMRVETPDGKLIHTINTGNIARTDTPSWVKCSMLYTVPSNVSTVLIKLINNGLGGCGNDLAMDDIQVRPCIPNLHISFNGDSHSSTVLCDGRQLTINSTLGSGFASPSYEWQESTDSLAWRSIVGATGINYNINGNGDGKRFYRLLSNPSVTSGDGTCSSYQTLSNVLTVESVIPTTFIMIPDTILCQGNQLTLSIPQSQPFGVRYIWFDSTSDVEKVISQTGTFWLESNRKGCIFRDSVTIEIKDCAIPQVYIPTTFTPNDDGVNDYLDVYAENIQEFEMRVYDRWGNLVFLSNSLNHRWNGEFERQVCLRGIYTWQVTYTVPGRSHLIPRIERQGRVLLLR